MNKKANMPELIDKQASMRAICEGCFKSRAVDIELKCRGTCNVIDIFQQQPTIEPEVRHGEWILCEDQHGVDNDNNNYAYFCSQCHYQDVHSKYAKVNFCWNCGSMNLEE